MNKKAGRCFAVLAAIGAMALMPSAASAQSVPYELLFHSTPDGTTQYQTSAGTVFTLLVSQLDSKTNQQAVSGFFSGGVITGVAFNHTYDRAKEAGSYGLIGTFAAPLSLPVPVLATIDTAVDRNHSKFVVKFNGAVGGQPLRGVSYSFTNPFYMPLG